MKGSWKSFGLQLVSTFVLGLGLAYSISLIVDARRGPDAPGSTLLSMILGGLMAPAILATLSGWKGWSLRPLLVASGIVATLYSGNPIVGLLSLLITTFCYLTARKVRSLAFYYSPSEPVESDTPPLEP